MCIRSIRSRPVKVSMRSCYIFVSPKRENRSHLQMDHLIEKSHRCGGIRMPKIFSDIEKDNRRNLLFEKGMQMIVARGYKNVTVDDLVNLIGSSKGYFYYLFESKEDFFLQAIRWQMQKNPEILSEARKNGASLEEVSQLYKKRFMQAGTTNYMDLFHNPLQGE